MLTPTLRSVFERAASDPAFRAQLLANPALAEGLTREQIETLLGEMSLLDGQLTDEMLDSVAAGISRSGGLDRVGSDNVTTQACTV